MSLIIGDVRDVLPTLDSQSVQMCVTSPPYWGLRDYGVENQLGLEKTPEEFVENMVGVFREVRRVLKDDGTCWVNLGDAYAASSYGSGGGWAKDNDPRYDKGVSVSRRSTFKDPGYKHGLKAKDMVGIPWRVAFALQADGWYLRQDIVWAKPNPMPESVTDRCTKAHEYLFLLSKSARYWFDAEAIAVKQSRDWATESVGPQYMTAQQGRNDGGKLVGRGNGNTVNKRSVWTIPSAPYADAHFATFPPKLIEPCILAGSRPGDVVLDPFFGSGTTGEVCERLGRKWQGIELNPEYGEMAKRRTAQMGLGL